MDNPRPEKVAVVEEVRRYLDEADAAILTEYRGINVKGLAGLRRSLRASGGEYKIYKNTLVRLAVQDAGLDQLRDLLVGPTGIAFVRGDAAAVAKSLRDYSRTNPHLVIKGGVLGGRIIGVQETNALADLPSREVMLARFAGAVAAPLQQFAGLLQALPRNLAFGLAALRDKLAEAEAAALTEVEPEPAGVEVEPEPAGEEAEAEPPVAGEPGPGSASDPETTQPAE
ncbi:MAG: 50S ribosomal protein L10 [Acidimicrobiales bacterium]